MQSMAPLALHSFLSKERFSMLTIDGLASGLDTTSIISQILDLERRPLSLMNFQITQAQERQTAFLDLSARLLNLQVTTRSLSEGSTFEGVSVSSSNEDVLAASASAGVPPGSYAFRVAQMARASQFVSRGFADSNQTAVGAGTLSFEVGGGSLAEQTELSELNGGSGIQRGSFRITDSAGNTAVIDLSSAITVDDVITSICVDHIVTSTRVNWICA